MESKKKIKLDKSYHPNKRHFRKAIPGHDTLGPLQLLPGEWVGKGTGWNMIALPFQGAQPPNGNRFRILMNQYDEELSFSLVDDNIPNRGLVPQTTTKPPNSDKFDQKLVSLDYTQMINQICAEDFPVSGLAGDAGLAIHHEPGLWLYMKNLTTEGLNVARLATIPHGNSLLALGKSSKVAGMPDVPPINGLPIGRFEDLDSGRYDFNDDPYLAPYKKFIDYPFFGKVKGVKGFPGFSPKNMNAILNFANKGVKIKNTTILSVDTAIENAGVVNIPFIVKQAEAVSMRSTFWIQELEDTHPDGSHKLRLQYSQVVMLDFFRPREDQLPGRATWPHISINTLEKVYKKY